MLRAGTAAVDAASSTCASHDDPPSDGPLGCRQPDNLPVCNHAGVIRLTEGRVTDGGRLRVVMSDGLLTRCDSCIARLQGQQRLQLARNEPTAGQREMIAILIQQALPPLRVAERSVAEDRSGIEHFERRYPRCQCADQASIAAAAVIDGGPCNGAR